MVEVEPAGESQVSRFARVELPGEGPGVTRRPEGERTSTGDVRSAVLSERISVRRWVTIWQALYLAAIGFSLIPVAAWWRNDDGANWRLLPFLVCVLLMVRFVSAVVRRMLPFPGRIATEWSRQRLLAKRFDSYQWRKLLWLGFGLGTYLVMGRRTLAVPSVLVLVFLAVGSFAALRWRFLVRSGRVSGNEGLGSRGLSVSP